MPWKWYLTWDETRPFGWSWLPDISRDTVQFIVGGALVHTAAWLSAFVAERMRRKKEKVTGPLPNEPKAFPKTNQKVSEKKGARFLALLGVTLLTGGVGGFCTKWACC